MDDAGRGKGGCVMDARAQKRIAAMPAATWQRLDMNDATLDVEDELEHVSSADVVCSLDLREGAEDVLAAFLTGRAKGWSEDWDSGAGSTWEGWMAAAEATFADSSAADAWRDTGSGRTAGGDAKAGSGGDEGPGGDVGDGGIGETALSAYQERVRDIESSGSVRATFECGLGEEASEWLRGAAGGVHTFTAPTDAAGTLSIAVEGVDGALNACAADVLCGANSNVCINITADSPTAGSGMTATTLRIFCETGSTVVINRVQTLDDSWVDLDDIGLFLSDGATVEVRQTVLGAAKSYTGLAGDLRGDGSTARISARYLGHGEQELDFNYILRHHGKKTTSELTSNGVLTDSSSKCLRGTIDLMRGAKGAEGTETDTVLLADDGVVNKTVPCILCSEDDVAGNHGATIGHISGEQLFYLASRGIPEEAAEDMFASAVLEEAYLEAVDETARAAVERLAGTLVEDFDEMRA